MIFVCDLQVYVRARELNGNGESLQTARLEMIIQRNQRAPQFTLEPFDRTITYLRPVSNDPVVDINATDTDIFQVIKYTLVADEEAKQYFRVDPDTGVITQIGDLRNTQSTVFNVSKSS